MQAQMIVILHLLFSPNLPTLFKKMDNGEEQM